ncbi:hypothetical protein Tcan_04863 [Toxocara canis]|uniref:Uncharacterized protein n=1 Tax=Toxocara canis TaxID=6265 RepID=A0A0B2VLL6_TOXCA|nr:hypothetical protein Tcan_04863 [Toxocara canis]
MPRRRSSAERSSIFAYTSAEQPNDDEEASLSSRTWRVPSHLPACTLYCCPFPGTQTATPSPEYCMSSSSLPVDPTQPSSSTSKTTAMHHQQQISQPAATRSTRNVQQSAKLLSPTCQTIPSRCEFPFHSLFVRLNLLSRFDQIAESKCYCMKAFLEYHEYLIVSYFLTFFSLENLD